MATPPSELPPPPSAQSPPGAPTHIAGQQTTPSTMVPAAPLGAPMTATGRQTNTLAVASLVTALVAPFGHIVGVGGITLIVVSLVTGHMARAQIRRTGENGAGLALIGLIISYAHLAATVLLLIFFFGFIIAIFGAFIHAASGG